MDKTQPNTMERALKDEEEVRAILRFTKVNKKPIKKQAKKDGTLEIWKSLLES